MAFAAPSTLASIRRTTINFAGRCPSHARPSVPSKVNVRAQLCQEIASSDALSTTPGTITDERSREKRNRTIKRIARVSIGVLALSAALLRVFPLCAATGTAAVAAVESTSNFVSGVTASLALVLASEIGDKTFFISALLSMRYSRILVLLGTMLALGSMTIISVGLGQLAHAVPATLKLALPLDDYAAVVLLVYFGIQNIRDGWRMKEDESDELDGAKEVVTTSSGGAVAMKSPFLVVSETTSLVFFAEWGDKSMLATVALAAAKNPLGVIVGGISGHFIASVIAVIGGSLLGKYISERNARLSGGVLFLIFAALTLRGVW